MERTTRKQKEECNPTLWEERVNPITTNQSEQGATLQNRRSEWERKTKIEKERTRERDGDKRGWGGATEGCNGNTSTHHSLKRACGIKTEEKQQYSEGNSLQDSRSKSEDVCFTPLALLTVCMDSIWFTLLRGEVGLRRTDMQRLQKCVQKMHLWL